MSTRSGSVALWLIGAAAAAKAAVAQDTGRIREYRYLMGTSIEVEAYGGTDVIRRTAIDEAFKAFGEIDRLMSNHRDDSELFPGMSAVIAYRRPDGIVALAISPRLRPVFHSIAS